MTNPNPTPQSTALSIRRRARMCFSCTTGNKILRGRTQILPLLTQKKQRQRKILPPQTLKQPQSNKNRIAPTRPFLDTWMGPDGCSIGAQGRCARGKTCCRGGEAQSTEHSALCWQVQKEAWLQEDRDNTIHTWDNTETRRHVQ